MLRRLGALFRRRPRNNGANNGTRQYNNGVRQAMPRRQYNNGVRQAMPRRNKNAGLRKLRAITTAKTGAARWAARARQAVARRGVPTMPSPRRYSYNNVMILLPSGRAVPPNTYYKWEEYQRLLKRGYSNNAARAASGY